MKPLLLHDQHATLGATWGEEGGAEVPLHYGDVVAEYRAMCTGVGVSDLSHRGKIRVTGDDRVKWLQSIISNDLLKLQSGQGTYSSFLTHKGKMLSYFRAYVLPDVVWLEDVGEIEDATFLALKKFLLYGTKAKMENCGSSWGLLLVSGPQAALLMATVSGIQMGDQPMLTVVSAEIAGYACLLVRTEETGETDIEIFVPIQGLPTVWDRLWSVGAPLGLKAIGSQAREVLRLEAGLPKAGKELTEEIVPPEANLEGKAFSLNKGCYPGQEVVARMDTYGNVRRRMVGMTLSGDLLPPHGAKLFSGDREVGWVSSAAMSSAMGCLIALGFPLRDFSAPGTELSVQFNEGQSTATVHALPFDVRRPETV
jgi:folate-binding protein YgfZ